MKLLQFSRARYRFLLLIPFAATSFAFGQTGTIRGTVIDTNHGSIARAQVKLSMDPGVVGAEVGAEVLTAADGTYSFANVRAGSYHLTFSAPGFAPETMEGEIQAGETLNLPAMPLTVEVVTAQMDVTLTAVEIAEAQVKEEEKQRVFGLVPNFLATYDPHPAPLNAKQKFELTWKTFTDPAAFVVTGLTAAAGQLQNTHKGFGQGWQGYGKRYGAAYAELATTAILERSVLPTLLHQDPRYYYKGTGSGLSRFAYAISRSVICQGDNGKAQLCTSRLAGRFGESALNNLYLPAADRYGTGYIFENGAFGIAGNALGNLFREFVYPKMTHKIR